MITLLKKLFVRKDRNQEIKTIPWSKENENEFELFASAHFISCGSPSPWVSFKYVGNKVEKKMTCPICKTEVLMARVK